MQVTITYTPAGYCGFFNICGWADHAVDDPGRGRPFTDLGRPGPVEFRSRDPSKATRSSGHAYGAGEFSGLGNVPETITAGSVS